MLIPGLNDDLQNFREMLEWISDKLGKDTVMHINRYFPRYKSSIPPTPVEKLEDFFGIATEKLNYVYIGNYSGNMGQNTYCPSCGELQISRNHYDTKVYLDADGRCGNCGYGILVTPLQPPP